MKEVKDFWDKNPLSAGAIDVEPGTVGFFIQYNKRRELNEQVPFAKSLDVYDRFVGKRVLEGVFYTQKEVNKP